MTGLCTAFSHAGFWAGLWDGLTAPITLIVSIFFDVTFYDVCARSWWYNCMFMFGAAVSVIFGIYSPMPAIITFVIAFVAFIIWFIFANIWYIIGIALVCLIVMMGLGGHGHVDIRWRKSFRQADGSEVIPPGE